MESDFNLDIELSLFVAALAIIFYFIMHNSLLLSHYDQYVAAGNQFLCEVQGFFMELHGFLCGIEDVSGPIRLHHLLQV